MRRSHPARNSYHISSAKAPRQQAGGAEPFHLQVLIVTEQEKEKQ
jgi:hypothetical protein